MEIKIILVEDEKIIALLLNKVLEKRGYPVFKTFDTADDAVIYVNENKVDVVLMDIYLKGNLNGIEAAKQINQISGAIIIYITANAESAAKEQALQTRHFGYFEKPLSDVEIDEICEIINSNFNK